MKEERTELWVPQTEHISDHLCIHQNEMKNYTFSLIDQTVFLRVKYWFCFYQLSINYENIDKDTKGIFRSRKSKTGNIKSRKKSTKVNNNVQNATQKTNDWVTWISLIS